MRLRTRLAPHEPNCGAKSQGVCGQEVMRLLHGRPFKFPCDADATARGAPHGQQKRFMIASNFIIRPYTLIPGGQNATFAARIQSSSRQLAGGRDTERPLG